MRTMGTHRKHTKHGLNITCDHVQVACQSRKFFYLVLFATCCWSSVANNSHKHKKQPTPYCSFNPFTYCNFDTTVSRNNQSACVITTCKNKTRTIDEPNHSKPSRVFKYQLKICICKL